MTLVKNPPCHPMSRDLRSMISNSPLSNHRPPHLLHVSMTTASATRRLIMSMPSTGHLRNASPVALILLQHSPQKTFPKSDALNWFDSNRAPQRKHVSFSAILFDLQVFCRL